ncbi:MAG: helix-turn-helix domain-containing protein [Clostridium sp.]|uniref:helix-turn-helix domain-containing protein n=1 Tax=Clostridium sp. TaxID=1506 RepID=UPI003EE5EB2E
MLGSETIYLYIHLLSKINYNRGITVTLKQLKTEISIRGFTKPKAILDKLQKLKQYNLIAYDGDQFKLNDIITITVPEIKIYEKIPLELIQDSINAIGAIGLVLLMLLTKLHNTNKGYANPSHEYLAYALGIDKRSVINYIDKLEQSNLITKQVSDVMNVYDDKDNPTFARYNNRYKVRYITDKRSKHYIGKE